MALHWGHSPPVHEGQHDYGDHCGRSKWLHAVPAPGFDVVSLGHAKTGALCVARFFSPECAMPVSVICCHGSSWCECRSHGRICTAYKPGFGLRLSQPATPAPALTLGVRHLSCGVPHLSCWAAQSASGRGIRASLRAALRLHPCACPSGPHSRPRGAAFVLRGVSLVLRGRSVALCSPRDARPSQCIRTNNPFRGALPPACWPPPIPAARRVRHVTRSLKTPRQSLRFVSRCFRSAARPKK